MITEEQKIGLKEQIQKSSALSEDNKTLLLEIFDSLPDSELENLAVSLQKEKNITNQVEQKYAPQELEVQQEYLGTMKKISTDTLKKGFKEWEKSESAKDEENSAKLIDNINSL